MRYVRKISRKLARRFSRLTGNTIIQFSPPRSGSTLVYNLLMEIFPRKTIVKKHSFHHTDANIPTVVTYRHPLDGIASSLLRYQLPRTMANIDRQIADFEQFSLWLILDIQNRPEVLMLRYEAFVGDFDVIFDGVEQHFGVMIPSDQRSMLCERYDLSVISEKVSSMNSFKDIDPITHWHGDHISPFRGRPGYFKEYFTDEQIRYLRGVYRDYLSIFDYD